MFDMESDYKEEFYDRIVVDNLGEEIIGGSDNSLRRECHAIEIAKSSVDGDHPIDRETSDIVPITDATYFNVDDDHSGDVNKIVGSSDSNQIDGNNLRDYGNSRDTIISSNNNHKRKRASDFFDDYGHDDVKGDTDLDRSIAVVSNVESHPRHSHDSQPPCTVISTESGNYKMQYSMVHGYRIPVPTVEDSSSAYSRALTSLKPDIAADPNNNGNKIDRSNDKVDDYLRLLMKLNIFYRRFR